MRRYMLLLVAASIAAFAQYAVAGRCEIDVNSPIDVDKAVLNFDGSNTEPQDVTVTNMSGADMAIYVFIPGEWGGYGWGGYPGWGGPYGYGPYGSESANGQGYGYGRGYGRGYGYGSGGFEGLGCDGEELPPGGACTITVDFVAGPGGARRQYHKKMTIGGVTADGEFTQIVCLDATN